MDAQDVKKIKPSAFSRMGKAAAAFFKKVGDGCKKRFAFAKEILTEADGKVMASMCVMGLGQLLYKQWAKGIVFLALQALFIVYFVLTGASDLFGFFTLGQVEGNAWYGIIEGDNSVVMLITGIFAILMLILYIGIYIANVKDAYAVQCAADTLKQPKSFKSEMSELVDKKFYKTALALPVLGVCVFSIQYSADRVHDTDSLYELRRRHRAAGFGGLGRVRQFRQDPGAWRICSDVFQNFRLEYAMGDPVYRNKLFCRIGSGVIVEQGVRKGQSVLARVSHSGLCDTGFYNFVGI